MEPDEVARIVKHLGGQRGAERATKLSKRTLGRYIDGTSPVSEESARKLRAAVAAKMDAPEV